MGDSSVGFEGSLEDFIKAIPFEVFSPFVEYHEEMDWISFLFRDCSYTADWYKDNSVALLIDNHASEGQTKLVGFTIGGVKSFGVPLEEKSFPEIMFEIVKNHPEIIRNLTELIEAHGFKLIYGFKWYT